MSGHILRGRGVRRRGGVLLRAAHASVPQVVTGAGIGNIYRFMYPEVVSDYESVSDTAWDEDSFYPGYSGTTPSGNLANCLFFALEVPDDSSDSVSVIMDPLRYAVDEAAADADPYDRWLTTSGDGQTSIFPGTPISALNTLLPISGDSHMSGGDVGQFSFAMTNTNYKLNVLDVYCGWTPGTVQPVPALSVVRPLYVRLRINGSAVGDLIDFSTLYSGETLFKSPSQLLHFPIGTETVGTNDLAIDWQLSFDAGDTFELDVWWQIAVKPHPTTPGSGTKFAVIAIPRYEVADGYRQLVNSSYNSVSFRQLPLSTGFNPDVHTYSFDLGTNTWYPGDGTSGPQRAAAYSEPTVYPELNAVGTFTSSAGGATFPLPAGVAENDILRLWIETANETLSAPSGYTQKAVAYTGTAGGTGATRLYLFWKRATASESDPSVSAPGDHVCGFVDSVRGCLETGDPFGIVSTNVEASPVFPGTATAATNSTPYTLISVCGAIAFDSTSTMTCTITNATLVDFASQVVENCSDGNGGGIALATGTMSSTGTTGATTFEWQELGVDVPDIQAFIVAAMKPAFTPEWDAPTITAYSLTWSGYVLSDHRSATLTLDWQGEIALLTVYVAGTGGGTWYYRPQDTGDYPAEVADRKYGTVYNSPCGVFSHMGTTVFERWYGTDDTPYSGPYGTHQPETITVALDTQ